MVRLLRTALAGGALAGAVYLAVKWRADRPVRRVALWLWRRAAREGGRVFRGVVRG